MIAECLNIFRRSDRTIEHPAVPIDGKAVAKLLGDGVSSASGVKVTKDSALGLPAFWRAVNLISGDVAKLPCHVYKRREGGGKDRDTRHPSYYRIRWEPNGYQSAFQFRRTLTGHAIIHGNGYAYIFRRGDASVDEMYMLDPYATYPVRERGGRELYVTTIGDEQRKLLPENVLHIRGYSWDGMCGMSLIDLCKDALGLPIAQQRASGKFFANGSKAGGVLMFPGHINREAQEELLKDFDSKAEGLDNMHKTILLEDGVKYQQLTISPEDSQLVESAQFSNRQIALLTGVPVNKLGDTETNAYASLEEMNQSYLDEGLDFHLGNWEDELRKKCLTEREKREDTHVVEFIRAALVRANIEKRYNAYAVARQWGWASADDVRDFENQNPIDQEGGKDYHMPINFQKLGAPPPEPTSPEPAPEPAPRTDPRVHPQRDKLIREKILIALRDAKGRMVRRLAVAVQRAAKRPAGFAGWLDAGMHDEHYMTVRGTLEPHIRALALLDNDPEEEQLVAEAVSAVFDLIRQKLLPVSCDFTRETLAAQVDDVLKGITEEAA